jgi:tetratricopeptide (TPR) repeat protein
VLYQLQRYPQATESYLRYLHLDDRSARVSYKLALTDYASGNLDAAVSALGQVLRVNDTMADAYYLLGMCLRDTRRDREAVQAFEKAVSRSTGLIAAREELADLYASSGRRADELEQLQMIAGLDRDHVERQVAVGLAQARAGHAELAVQTLGNALERASEPPPIYAALGRVWLDIAQTRNDRVALGKALEALGLAASSPNATSDVLAVYGQALLQDGQTDLAERVLRQASSRYPLEPAALLWYATAAEKQSHFEAARDALVDYGELTTDEADFPSRAMQIAALSLRLDDPPAAVVWLRRAVTVAPHDVHVLTALADAELRSGNREAARDAVARGLEQDPSNPALLSMARRSR